MCLSVIVADGSRQEWVGRQCNVQVACRGSDIIGWIVCPCVYTRPNYQAGARNISGDCQRWQHEMSFELNSVCTQLKVNLARNFIEFDSRLKTSDQAWLCLVRSICRGRSRCHWALIARSKHTKGLNLLDEVCDAGPSSPSDPNHHDPYAHKYVHQVYGCPAW